MALDLADVIERTRRLKRTLSQPPFGLPVSVVYRNSDLIDLDNLEELLKLLIKIEEQRHFAKAEVTELQMLIVELGKGVPRPDDRELCRRYAAGLIDARTVCHITKWTMIDLYDQCVACGFSVPDFGNE